MTIRQALDQLDKQQPNDYTEQEKLVWLSQLDGQAVCEVFLTHTDPPCSVPPCYEAQDNLDQNLLIPPPYDQIYPVYLGMQIDRCNGELSRYDSAAQLFNNLYLTFQAWWNRNHTPLGQTGLKW